MCLGAWIWNRFIEPKSKVKKDLDINIEVDKILKMTDNEFEGFISRTERKRIDDENKIS